MLYHFIFIFFFFFQRMQSVRCLRLEDMNFPGFFFEANGKCNTLDLTLFRNQVHHWTFQRERERERERQRQRETERERHTERETYRERVGHRFILTDFFFSPPVSLQITAIASLTRETSAVVPKKLLKKELTYLSFKADFMFIFAAAKASLVIYIKLEVLSDLPWRR